MASIPLYEKICGAIRGEIAAGALVPGAKIPSVAELKELHKVSHLTILRVYRELVAAGDIVQRGRGYFVPGGDEPAVERAGCIGMLVRPLGVHNRRDIYFDLVNHGIQEGCCAANVDFLTPCVVRELLQRQLIPERAFDEIAVAAERIAPQVDGFLFDERLPDEVIARIIRRTGKTGVVLNRTTELELDSVTPDNESAVRQMLGTAVRLGYRNFIFCENGHRQDNYVKRVDAFLRLRGEFGIAPESCITVEDHTVKPHDVTVTDLKRAVDTLMPRGKTLILSSNDYYARACCRDLDEWHMTPGKELGVAGIDGIGEALNFSPVITTVKVDPVRIGKLAVALLVRRLASATGAKPVNHVTDVAFEWGETI